MIALASLLGLALLAPPASPSAPSQDGEAAPPPPPVESPTTSVAEAVQAGVALLLERQEGAGRDEWPYQGVYRVRAEADDPESLTEGRGRRRTVIPIGYRVGGTGIAGCALLRPDGLDDDEPRRAALERARRFVAGAIGHPRMNPEYAGGYDVRGWGYIYGLRFLLEMRDRGLVPEGDGEAHDGAIRFYLDGLDRIAIPEVGGWNYARRGPLDQPDATSPFMTPPAVQALVEASRQGFEVADGLVDRAMTGLDLTRGADGHVAYAARRPTREPSTQIPGAIGRMLAVETVRSELGRNTDEDVRRALEAFFTHWDQLLVRKGKTGTHEPPYGVAPYYFMFAHGYAAEAIERLPEEERPGWRARLQARLLEVRDGADGWNDRVFPRSAAYGTSMALLALTQPDVAPRASRRNSDLPEKAPPATAGDSSPAR